MPTAGGRRQRMTYPDGMYFTYVYNSAGDPTGILENGTTSLATFGYDNLGRRTSLTRANGSVVTNYDFDDLSRLDYLNQNVAGTGHDLTVDFDHDPASRVTARVSSNALFEQMLSLDRAESYVADGLNQYDSAFGMTPSYDVRGNRTPRLNLHRVFASQHTAHRVAREARASGIVSRVVV